MEESWNKKKQSKTFFWWKNFSSTRKTLGDWTWYKVKNKKYSKDLERFSFISGRTASRLTAEPESKERGKTKLNQDGAEKENL